MKVARGPAFKILDLMHTLSEMSEGCLKILHFVLLWGGTNWIWMVRGWGIRRKARVGSNVLVGCAEVLHIQMRNVSSYTMLSCSSVAETHLYWLGALKWRY
jgi:hypothetical protein